MIYSILIVDDSLPMRSVIKKTLGAAGYGGSEILEAQNGQEALEMMRHNWVDVVLTDYNMPVMNGLELLKALRELPATKRTPVLMLTTETKDELKAQGKALGLTGWIVKPFNPTQLKSAITRVLRLPACWPTAPR